MISPENKIVQSLWIGKTLSLMELLTIKSFVACGHEFHLYCYETLETQLPDGAFCKDATEILPKSAIFRYNHTNQFGHGKGSVSGFSDVFRYKLLFEKGGWYTDMDVLALKPLNINEHYFFRNHHVLPLVGNVMKAPAKSTLMQNCFETAYREINADNKDWHKPIQILVDEVIAQNLTQFIVSHSSNLDSFTDVMKYYFFNRKPPENWLFIHWTNENFRAKNIDKNRIRYRSFYGQQLQKFGLIKPNIGFWELLKNELQFMIHHLFSLW